MGSHREVGGALHLHRLTDRSRWPTLGVSVVRSVNQ
jgi:hypothetical protein